MSEWRGGEAGSLWMMRLGGRMLRLLGRRGYSIFVIIPVIGLYAIFDRRARRGSQHYLRILASTPEGRRAIGARPGLRHTFRHFYEFALQLADRALLWSGGDGLTVEYTGDEYLRRIEASGRGAIMIGGHQGSFDMMRMLAASHGVPVNVLMFTDKAEELNAYFRELNPGSAIRVLRIDPSSVRTAFEIKACIDRGEFVGILGDRKGLFPDADLHEGRLLGRKVEIPLRPFSMAAVIGCPILHAACLRISSDTYRVTVTPLRPLEESGVRAPRSEQPKIATELAESYMAQLERGCLQAPYQWFNFFDYFESFDQDGEPAP